MCCPNLIGGKRSKAPLYCSSCCDTNGVIRRLLMGRVTLARIHHGGRHEELHPRKISVFEFSFREGWHYRPVLELRCFAYCIRSQVRAAGPYVRAARCAGEDVVAASGSERTTLALKHLTMDSCPKQCTRASNRADNSEPLHGSFDKPPVRPL